MGREYFYRAVYEDTPDEFTSEHDLNSNFASGWYSLMRIHSLYFEQGFYYDCNRVKKIKYYQKCLGYKKKITQVSDVELVRAINDKLGILCIGQRVYVKRYKKNAVITGVNLGQETTYSCNVIENAFTPNIQCTGALHSIKHFEIRLGWNSNK